MTTDVDVASVPGRPLERRWLARRSGLRAVAVTPLGRRELAAWLGVEPAGEHLWRAV
jgi:hypothetical protein